MNLEGSAEPPSSSTPSPLSSATPIPAWPYLAPMGIFLLLTSLESYLPHQPNGSPSSTAYTLFYGFKIVAVVVALIVSRRVLADLKPRPSAVALALAIALGLVVTAVWIGLEQLPYPRLPLTGGRESFDPTTLSPTPRYLFLALRFLGLVILVPIIEEVFWRSFLMRWIIDQDFWKVPVGHVTLIAAGVTSALFAAAHPEWLPALLTGLAWAWLLFYTRSLSACLVSHAVANLALGLYVLSTSSWQLW